MAEPLQESSFFNSRSVMLGIGIATVGYFFIASMSLSAKQVSEGVPPMLMLFFQNFVCLLLLLPVIHKKGWQSLKTERLGLHMLRCSMSHFSFFGLFYTVKFMLLAEALLLQYSCPLWVPFVVFVGFKQRIQKRMWPAILIGFLGIALILKPTTNMLNLSMILGAMCGISQAVSLVCIKRLSLTEPAWRMMFYYFVSGSIISLPFALTQWTPEYTDDIVALVGVGICMFIAQRFITASYVFADVTVLASLCYTSILFSGLLGWAVWKDIPDTLSIAGMLLVVCCGIATYVLSKPSRKHVEAKSVKCLSACR